MEKHYDYIAIGGGSGGIASINRAAMHGAKCALIEPKFFRWNLCKCWLCSEKSHVVWRTN